MNAAVTRASTPPLASDGDGTSTRMSESNPGRRGHTVASSLALLKASWEVVV